MQLLCHLFEFQFLKSKEPNFKRDIDKMENIESLGCQLCEQNWQHDRWSLLKGIVDIESAEENTRGEFESYS